MNDWSRQAEQGATELEHEPDSGEGYRPGEGGAVGTAPDGVPFSAVREEAARQAGYCAAEVPDGGVCPWLLLASSSGLPQLYYTDEPQGVVAGEARRERGQGQSSCRHPQEAGVEGDRGLGVRNGEARLAESPGSQGREDFEVKPAIFSALFEEIRSEMRLLPSSGSHGPVRRA